MGRRPGLLSLKVIFRKFKDGFKEIIALFPELNYPKYTVYKEEVTSYLHIGQHGAANLSIIKQNTIEAKEPEYKELMQELKQIGYKRLKVVKL